MQVLSGEFGPVAMQYGLNLIELDEAIDPSQTGAIGEEI